MEKDLAGRDIFLSYSWSDELTANQIDSLFSFYQITLLRDVRDLKYKQSISEFMKKVRATDNVILILTENYLKSRNCMYEVLEFLKDETYKSRILPFVHVDANLFSSDGKLKYLDFWNREYIALKSKIASVDPTEAIPLLEELKKYERIKKEIVEFLAVISDMNTIVYSSDIDLKTMEKVFDYLGLSVYETKDIVVQISKAEESDGIDFEERLKLIPLAVSSFTKRNSTKEMDTYVLKVKKNLGIRRLHSILSDMGIASKSKVFDVFPLEDAYLILSKEKTKTWDTKTLIWWAPHSNGYTEETSEAGIYSKKQVREYIYQPKGFEDHSVVGVPKRLFDSSIDLKIVPNTNRFLSRIEDIKDFLIGDTNWKQKEFIRKDGIPRHKEDEDVDD